jgi:hypothetical protein
MPIRRPLIVTLLLLLLVAIPAAGASPVPSSPGPAATSPAVASPSSSVTATTFTSDTYGYSLTVPTGWTTVQATTAWDGHGAPGSDDPKSDQFVSPATASAWAYAAPTSLDSAAYAPDRIAGTYADHSDTCPATPEVQEPIEIGGEVGTFLAWDCGILINQAVIVHDGIGITFGLRDPGIHAATDPGDRATLEQILDSVRFAE